MKSLYGHCAFILHSSMFILGGIGDQKITGFNYIYSLHFINPSFRKPVIEHMLNDFCKQVSFEILYFIVIASLSYGLRNTLIEIT